jgi:hypothetical protein
MPDLVIRGAQREEDVETSIAVGVAMADPVIREESVREEDVEAAIAVSSMPDLVIRGAQREEDVEAAMAVGVACLTL